MRDQPDGAELLAASRKLLREQILPATAGESRHALLMALNAISIAERQMRDGDGPQREELEALNVLLGQSGDDLREANRRLAQAIRGGCDDPGDIRRAAVFAHLRGVGRQRLRESNPKVLPESGV